MPPHPVVGMFEQSTTTRGRPPKQKIIKQEIDELGTMEDLSAAGYQGSPNTRPSVEILSCISYQKFRYSGENRPGKKYQEKDFMELKLENLGEKVVRVVIICTDADNGELIHPNGLVGKDCHDGIYDKEYAITKQIQNIKIPYLRTERIKTKKNELSKIRDILKSRAKHLPSPYRERCESQCNDQYTFNRKFDTTKVCLGVIVTVRSHYQGAVNGSLHAISHVVNNASEKTALGILKLSGEEFSPVKGGLVDIFTTENGPAIENDKYFLYVSYENDDGILWESERISPTQNEILYKRIITYMVPPFDYNTDIEQRVEATLHLDCPQSNQSCECQIFYSPYSSDFMIYDTSMKRSFTEELDNIRPPKRMRLSADKETSDVKTVLKESLKRREDDRRSSLPPAVEIVQRYDDGALVRRSDTHAVPDAMDQDVNSQNHPSHSPNNQDDQEFQVLCAAYSKSVPSDTVLIITNEDPDDIENAINKGVSYFEKPSIKKRESKETIIIDSSTNKLTRKSIEASSPKDNSKMTTAPDSKSVEGELNKTNEQTSKISRLSQDITRSEMKMSQSVKEQSTSAVAFKRNHNTDSPWAVGSDDESDEAMHILNELSSNKQKSSLDNYQKRVNNSDRIVLVEGQKTISILSSKGDAKGKLINSKEQENTSKLSSREDNFDLDFSRVPLPSDINLNSEIIANFDMVKQVSSSDLQSS